MSSDALGIDFGTSTTVGALSGPNGVTVLSDGKGASVFPSFVAYPPTGDVLVGDPAKYRRPIDPTNTLFSFKRVISQPFGSEVTKQFLAKYPFAMSQQSDGYACFETRAGKLSPTQVTAHLIRHIISLGKAAGAPSKAVVGVPAEFGSTQRAAIIDAVRLAGCEEALCVDEPLAIARACLKDDLETPRRIAVYDIGGGTFNLALCDVRGGACTLLAVGGDDYLGGDDVDQLCANWVNEQVLRLYGWDIRTSPQALTRLIAECERAKIMLSSMMVTRMKLGGIEPGGVLAGREVTIERAFLEKLTLDLVRRTFVICDEVLARAGMKAKQIDDVFLAGGTTRIPCIQAAVQTYFAKQPRLMPSPDHLVAIGAAIIAREQQGGGAQPMLRGAERRRDPRQKTSLRVSIRLRDETEFHSCFASDISRGGMFVAMENPPPFDTPVVLKIDLGAEQSLEIQARVVYRLEKSAQKPDAHFGAGLEYVGIQAETRQRLEDLLAQAQICFVPATR